MKLTCFEVDRRLIDYKTSELSHLYRWRIFAHLLHCGRCRRASSELEDLLSWFPRSDETEVPEHVRNSTLEALHREGFLKHESKRRVPLWAPAYAMGMVALLTIGFGVLGGGDFESKLTPASLRLVDSTLYMADTVSSSAALDSSQGTSTWSREEDSLSVYRGSVGREYLLKPQESRRAILPREDG